MVLARHHDIQQNDNLLNDTQHIGTEYNKTQHNDTQHNNTHHNDIQHDIKLNMTLSLTALRVPVLLSIIYTKCQLCGAAQRSPLC